MVARLSVADKNELLFQRGINYSELPAWQRRGVGVWWREVERTGVDPRTGATTIATGRELHRDLDLPLGDDYGEFVLRILAA